MLPDVGPASPCVVVYADNLTDRVILKARSEDVCRAVALRIRDQYYRTVILLTKQVGQLRRS